VLLGALEAVISWFSFERSIGRGYTRQIFDTTILSAYEYMHQRLSVSIQLGLIACGCLPLMAAGFLDLFCQFSGVYFLIKQ
jgi:hypothetical protein